MLQILQPPSAATDDLSVCVMGLGRVGLPTAALLASQGVRVTGVDTNPTVIDGLADATTEPGLDETVQAALAAGMLHATGTPVPADIFIIAVPTPLDGRNPDLSHVRTAARAIARVIEHGNMVILESTVPAGTTEQLACWLAADRPDLVFPDHTDTGADIAIAHCPERILPGRAMRELVDNDRVIGGLSPHCARRAAALFGQFINGDCVLTDARTAELVKLAENSARDLNLAFANELSVICDGHGVDVWEVIALANRHPRVDILRPGPGVGGHCIAVDPWFLAYGMRGQTPLVRTARQVNDAKPAWVVEKIEAAIGGHLKANPSAKAAEVSVACYGLTYKPDSDDLRESPSLKVVAGLAERHVGPLLVVEPHIDRLPFSKRGSQLVPWHVAASADIHVALVGHSAFRAADTPTGQLLDVCGLWRQPADEPA